MHFPPNPSNLPSKLGGPKIWSTYTFDSGAPSYVVKAPPSSLHEVEEALKQFKELGVEGDEVSSDNFVLPLLKIQLEKITHEVHDGRGFSVLRGLDTAGLPPEDALITYLGVAAYIGDMRGMQSRTGYMITHITDSNQWKAPYEQRHTVHTPAGLPFHTDMGCDILALQVRQCARDGGHTYVTSAWTLFNDLSASYRDVLSTLMRPIWPIQVSINPSRFILAPLLEYHEGKVMISVDPARIGRHSSLGNERDSVKDAPALTMEQRKALDVLSKLATKHRVRLDAQPGDIIFINNWAVLHARDSYIDWENANRRHLIRLWLHNSELGWGVPESMRLLWEMAYGSGEGLGYERDLRRAEPKYPVLPDREYKVPKYTSGSAAFAIEDLEGRENDEAKEMKEGKVKRVSA